MPTAGAALRARFSVTGFFSISCASVRDRRRHRRAEEQRLLARRQVPEHAADVGQEAHVEHAIGFVEHEELEPGQLRVGHAEVIEEAAGRGDDDVDAAAERVLLRPHADAAEDGGAAERRVHGQVVRDRRASAPRAHGSASAPAPGSCRAADPSADGGSAAGRPRSCRCRWRHTPRMSRPWRPGGMASFWMGVGRVKPSSLMPCLRLGCSANSLNGTEILASGSTCPPRCGAGNRPW